MAAGKTTGKMLRKLNSHHQFPGIYNQREESDRGATLLVYLVMPPSLCVFSKQNNALVSWPDGRPVDPSMSSHEFARIAKLAGLEGPHFHDLRHTLPVSCYCVGQSQRLSVKPRGHSSVAFTMDIYSHIIEGMQEDAMALLDEVIQAGVAELADAADLKSAGAILVGSSPTLGTT